jgi:hypothetical protein
MATKKKSAASSRSGGAAGAKKGEMSEGDMNRPVKEGLMEMPTGGEMHGGQGARGPSPGARSGMESGMMPGESGGGPGGPAGSEMPGGGMEST